MKQYSMIKYWLGLILLYLVACKGLPQRGSRVEQLPYYCSATFSPHWMAADDPRLDTFHRIPPFSLTNQLGQTITEKTFEGKLYVADFFFTTCPGICPKMTANMRGLQAAFADDHDVLLLSHSVTPERDSIPVLLNYGTVMGVNPERWHLVTGDRSLIYHLGRQAYFVEEDLGLEREPEVFLHTENFVLIDTKGYVRGIYNGLNSTDVAQLVADVRMLQADL